MTIHFCRSARIFWAGVVLLSVVVLLQIGAGYATAGIADEPLFLSDQAPPLNLLVMGRDHKLYYEAYNDASDLNGDGVLDVGYKPSSIDYYGYFNSYSCYEYDSGHGRFEPTSSSSDKTCSGTDEWSGDFLNYLTTSRIDAIRKVLYGGTRSTDSTSLTVLERANIPQDAHTWGKEYYNVAHDGYDIRDYTPLDLPAEGTRHLFANATLLNTTTPLLRILNDTTYRVWEWVSIEQPVAGSKCDNGTRSNCERSGGTISEIVPDEFFSGLQQNIYSATSAPTIQSHEDFESAVTTYAIAANNIVSQSVSNISGSRGGDRFLNIISGSLVISKSGLYEFFIDGDDAVEVIIDDDLDGYSNNDFVLGWYGAHSAAGAASSYHSGSVFLTAGNYPITFRHQELTGDASWDLYWGRTVPSSVITDYTVRVEVCNSSYLESNCQAYSDGTNTAYKPVGLLHEYGEPGKMKFGLLTGSYQNNTQGGVLRKAVSDFNDEVNPTTGQFTNTVGIVKTLDRLKTVDFSNYKYSCGWITTRPMNNGECSMWGNPIAEMMYEGVRYFAGKGAPTSEFNISTTGNDDADLGLPLAAWDDPYSSNPTCSQPFELVISDINPSYDSDSLPGVNSNFGSGGGLSGSDHLAMDVEALGQTIWDHEYGGDKSVFIGQVGSEYDGSPSPKTASSFGDIRGLAPEEPTKQGSYYPASVAYYARITDLNTAADDQKMSTFSVALASPLPEINIPVGGQTITLVPFGKSVGGQSISATKGRFQPTNQIVDFYVESLSPTKGVFRINYEDVEQGADHDMDAIVKYTYEVNADNTVTVTLESQYAAGGIKQHMGYVISGTTHDGTYLEVRDIPDNSSDNDVDYFLDTPPGELPNGHWQDNKSLPLTASRKFTPATNANAAVFLKDPLWYAAKYGFFDETVNNATPNDLPDSVEYDADQNGAPDNYFLVTNALTLTSQLSKAFDDIVGANTSAASVSSNSTRLGTNTSIYQASFNTESWAGSIKSYPLQGDGSIGGSEWEAGQLLDAVSSPEVNRKIYTIDPASGVGIPFDWSSLAASQQAFLNKDIGGASDGLGELRVDYLKGARCNEEQYETSSPTASCYNGFFRDRNSILGDVVNSDPWFVGTQNYGYKDLPGTEGASYVSYRNGPQYLNRTGMLYVGANDGMLHAFDAGVHAQSDPVPANAGKEIFAYVPNGVFSKLSALTAPSYTHHYYVDGPARATDAYVDVNGGGNYNWETILVGSLGAGGKGVYALRVTDPDNFSASDILWEVDPSTSGYQDLGHVLDQPFVVRMANGQWAAIFGNGYESNLGHAVLYIADLTTGALIKSIDVGGTSNGLSGVAPVDFHAGMTDSIVDTIYAGDLLGQMWKFDVSDANTSKWESAFTHNASGTKVPDPLFTARGPSGNVQPITARPEIGVAVETVDVGDLMVYFGTGQYFENGDNVVVSSPNIESMYGILDKGTRITATDRSSLVEQTIDTESNVSGFEARILSSNPIDFDTKMGWYLDLKSPSLGPQGERIVERPQLSSGYLIYVTLIPNKNVCEFGGDSWTMIVNPATGGNLGKTVFDVNGDGLYDSGDNVGGTTVSGRKSTTGIISSPAIISAGDVLHLITSGTDMSNGNNGNNGINDETISSDDDSSGRGSWRQIR